MLNGAQSAERGQDQDTAADRNFLQDKNAAQDKKIARYQKILCAEFPDFLRKYLSLGLLERLKGIGLLCGTDWTPLFKNRFYYSRFDHSLSCALIVWNWTRDKKMTLAALLHDVSTPAFSHVIDFKNGDALKQESTEDKNAAMILSDAELAALLQADGLCADDARDYHRFSICDNEVPGLSADRLEYMFPSGAALEGWFSLKDVKRFYGDLMLAKDERGLDEFCFKTKKIALDYFRRILKIGYFLQKNKDKIAMELLARVVDSAIKCGALADEELWLLSERQIIARWDSLLRDYEARETNAKRGTDEAARPGGRQSNEKQQELEAAALLGGQKIWGSPQSKGARTDGRETAAGLEPEGARDFLRLYKTYRTMKKVRGSDRPLDGYFCVRLDVKRRWINPLAAVGGQKADGERGTDASLGTNGAWSDGRQSNKRQQSLEAAAASLACEQSARRICDISKRARGEMERFLAYADTPYACVRLADL